MELNEQIEAAEVLLKFTQDYISIKKLLKVVKTGCAKSDLSKTSEILAREIKHYVEGL